jgi:hypothetical protein
MEMITHAVSDKDLEDIDRLRDEMSKNEHSLRRIICGVHEPISAAHIAELAFADGMELMRNRWLKGKT